MICHKCANILNTLSRNSQDPTRKNSRRNSLDDPFTPNARGTFVIMADRGKFPTLHAFLKQTVELWQDNYIIATDVESSACFLEYDIEPVNMFRSLNNGGLLDISSMIIERSGG